MLTDSKNSFTVGFCSKITARPFIITRCTFSILLHYLAKLVLRTRSTFRLSKFGKTIWYSSILGWRLTAHAAVTCYWLSRCCQSRLRSPASSLSSSKTVLLYTQLALWNGRHLPLCHQTCGSQQSITVQMTAEFGEKCSSSCTGRSSWHWWTDAVYATSGALLGANPDQWCNKWVVQMSLCMCSCQRRTFKHFIWLKSTHMVTFSFLSLWAVKVNQCYCVNVRFLLFLSFVFYKVV